MGAAKTVSIICMIWCCCLVGIFLCFIIFFDLPKGGFSGTIKSGTLYCLISSLFGAIGFAVLADRKPKIQSNIVSQANLNQKPNPISSKAAKAGPATLPGIGNPLLPGSILLPGSRIIPMTGQPIDIKEESYYFPPPKPENIHFQVAEPASTAKEASVIKPPKNSGQQKKPQCIEKKGWKYFEPC